ncbi:hypothetical protein [Brevibacillus dissolubilis]|uniref:hypothetical protein n=1 Tax=Brevibacillus dissolubilis TaxID=1844116 RepID=UPI0011178CCD|nr:hypothetical protein [Brevibacillus dissolubilis]
MKRTLSALMLTALFTVGVGVAHAEMSGFDLDPGMTSATTSRITIQNGENLYVSIYMYYNNNTPLSYTIFKEGVAFSSGTVSTTTRTLERVISPAPGEYSLRVYCNSKSNPYTSCSAYGGISDGYN